MAEIPRKCVSCFTNNFFVRNSSKYIKADHKVSPLNTNATGYIELTQIMNINGHMKKYWTTTILWTALCTPFTTENYTSRKIL